MKVYSIGECGLRGGYYELQNVPQDVRAQLTKLASISLCSNLVGQFATSLMVKPPSPGDPSFSQYESERGAILTSLASRAVKIAAKLNTLPGISCNAAEGAMYLFPQLLLPNAATRAAEAAGMPADEFYCLKLLEATGLVVVPGSGFKQVEGTFHFRTTFLPPESLLEEVRYGSWCLVATGWARRAPSSHRHHDCQDRPVYRSRSGYPGIGRWSVLSFPSCASSPGLLLASPVTGAAQTGGVSGGVHAELQ